MPYWYLFVPCGWLPNLRPCKATQRQQAQNKNARFHETPATPRPSEMRSHAAARIKLRNAIALHRELRGQIYDVPRVVFGRQGRERNRVPATEPLQTSDCFVFAKTASSHLR